MQLDAARRSSPRNLASLLPRLRGGFREAGRNRSGDVFVTVVKFLSVGSVALESPQGPAFLN